LSAIERGERKPTLETFYRLSIALDVKMSDLSAAIEENID
jgi:transcriptional regulator with XRE-family HTH domain